MIWSHNGEQWYDAVTGIIVPTDQWSHLTLTVQEGEAVFYINGTAKYTGKKFPNVFTSIDAEFGLGVNYWDIPFKGLMAEVRIYDRVAIPAAEVQSLYQHPGGITE